MYTRVIYLPQFFVVVVSNSWHLCLAVVFSKFGTLNTWCCMVL